MKKQLHIFVAEDDEDDRYFIKSAFNTIAPDVQLHFAKHGADLVSGLEQLIETGKPLPSLILLDLNMPVMGGKDALEIIKKHPALKAIPVIIFSTTTNQVDISFSYDAGANTFITKPSNYKTLEDMLRAIYEYWYAIASLKH